MKEYYQYFELSPLSSSSNSYVIVSREQIIKSFFSEWKEKMFKKFGQSCDLISEQNCIDDWIIIHWAWKVAAIKENKHDV